MNRSTSSSPANFPLHPSHVSSWSADPSKTNAEQYKRLQSRRNKRFNALGTEYTWDQVNDILRWDEKLWQRSGRNGRGPYPHLPLEAHSDTLEPASAEELADLRKEIMNEQRVAYGTPVMQAVAEWRRERLEESVRDILSMTPEELSDERTAHRLDQLRLRYGRARQFASAMTLTESLDAYQTKMPKLEREYVDHAWEYVTPDNVVESDFD